MGERRLFFKEEFVNLLTVAPPDAEKKQFTFIIML